MMHATDVCCRMKKLFVAAIVLFTTSVIILTKLGPTAIRKKITENIHQASILKPDNDVSWNLVKDPDSVSSVQRVFSFWNVTNVEKILLGEEKPMLDEIGPFVFDEKNYITYTERDEANDTVAYRKTVDLHFNPTLSMGNPANYTVIIPNYPLLGVYEALKSSRWKRFIHLILRIIQNEPLFVHRTVKQLLFGYTDPLLSRLRRFDSSIDPFITIERNNTSYDKTVLNSGASDPDKLGDIIRYNGRAFFFNSPWPDEYYNRPHGTEGLRFRPKCPKMLQMFVPSLFRTLDLINNDDGTKPHWYENVRVSRYVADSSFLNSGHAFLNYDNPWGTQNLTEIYRSPIFASKPHFLHSHPSYQLNVRGLRPDPSQHEISLLVEPDLGVTVLGNVAFQINALVDPLILPKHLTKNMERHKVYIPLFISGKIGKINHETLKKLSYIYPFIYLADIVEVYGPYVSVILLVAILLATLTQLLTSILTPTYDETQSNIDNDDLLASAAAIGTDTTPIPDTFEVLSAIKDQITFPEYPDSTRPSTTATTATSPHY